MLSEEALVFFAALVACGFLALGCLELIWPSRPRRRYPPPSVRALAVVMSGPGGLAIERFDTREPSVEVEEGGALERVRTLVAEGRIADALVKAARELERMGPAMPEAPDEIRATLWSVVGLGHQAADEVEGAVIAFETAIAFAPEDTRRVHEQRLRALVLDVVRSVASANAASGGEETVRSVCAALASIDRALIALPGDRELEGARERVSDHLWEAYEQAARALAAEGDTETARKLTEEALADPDVPSFVAARLGDLLASLVSEEIVHLTASALLGGRDVGAEETLEALKRVETLLGALPPGALSEDRRAEFDRRLWWGYVRVARRQIAAGEFQDALVALGRAHALRPEAEAEGRREARALFGRAVDGLVSTCAEAVVRLAEAGDESAASAHRNRLELAFQLAVSGGAPEGGGLADAVRRDERQLEDVGTTR